MSELPYHQLPPEKNGMKNRPMDNIEEIETVLTRSREARESIATAGQLNVEERRHP
ncbi:MAG: hypothetical protein ACREH8_14615 [Opitutaceae bacterium]